MFFKKILCVLCFAITLNPALAQDESQPMRAVLVSEVSSVAPGKPFTVAIVLKMQPPWYAYWKNPGESGFPMNVEWQLPPGFKASDIRFPYPQRVSSSGMIYYALKGEIWFLAEIVPPPSLKDAGLSIKGKAEWLGCSDICVPGSATLSLSLPVGAGKPNASFSKAFAQAKSQLPRSPTDLGWKISLGEGGARREGRIAIVPPAGTGLRDAVFFSETEPLVDHAKEQVFKGAGDGKAELVVPLSEGAGAWLANAKGVLVANVDKGEHIALEILPAASVVSGIKGAASTQFSAGDFISHIFYAFLGGLILNAMPCVLPVISLKILGFLQQGGDDRRKLIKHGAVFSFGVWFSFLAMATTLLILRAGGEKAGWGFQFQSPVFLVFMASLILVMGMSLFGVFQIGASLMGAGQELTGKEGLKGTFFSGVLATTLATPCTAPFMGAALGYAFVQPPLVTLLVFSSLAAGMSAPYFVFSLYPQGLKHLPKPGLWMEQFKQFTGFLMMATLLWILWIFGSVRGADDLVRLAAFCLVLGLCCWIYGQFVTPSATGRARLIAWVSILFLVLFASLKILRPALLSGEELARESQGAAGIPWKPFTKQVLDDALRSGQPVFVDFTAAWCLTCKVNEKTVLETAATSALFKEMGVIPIKADWTLRNQEITELLAANGRTGVPFYLFYPAGNRSEPVRLPEVLTQGVLAEKLKGVAK